MTTFELERQKSEGTPISIGTGMAIDSLLGLGEFSGLSLQPPIYDHRALWLNVGTLWRNAYNAYTTDVKTQLAEGVLLETLMEDIAVIASTIEQAMDRHFQLVFYSCQYEDFEKQFPHALRKQPSTQKQKNEQALEERTLKLFHQNLPREYTFKDFNTKIADGSEVKTLMLTHYPVDLLWHRKFLALTLLESHTGTLKEKIQWYTKLTGAKKLTRIPFNRMTLQVFGDGNVLFSSMDRHIKEEVVRLAEENKWTPATTYDKVRNDLNKIYDPRIKSFLLGLLKR